MQTNVEEIAKGLSDAQRDWINSHPPDRFHAANLQSAILLQDLVDIGVLKSSFDRVESCFGHTYTEAGLGVWDITHRTHLMENQDAK